MQDDAASPAALIAPVSALQPSLQAPTPPPPSSPRPIAPWAHTLALALVLTLTTLLGRARADASPDGTPRLLRYTTSILLEWLLLGGVIAGIYRRRDFFVTAFRTRADSLARVFAYGVAAYVLSFMLAAIVGGALYLTPLFHQRNEAVVLALLPRRPSEFVLWFGLSLTAGICEELIFRGYLLQQLTAWTRRPIASIFLAALLFGSVHLYEGVGAILPLAALAVAYGFVVRYFKGDLRAVIIAHTLQDFLLAFIVLARPFVERHQPHP